MRGLANISRNGLSTNNSYWFTPATKPYSTIAFYRTAHHCFQDTQVHWNLQETKG